MPHARWTEKGAENSPGETLLTLFCCIFQLSVDEVLHLSRRMDEAESLHGRRREDVLLNVLTETIRGLEAVRRCRDRGAAGGRGRMCGEPGRGRGEEMKRGREEGTLSPAGEEREDEERGGNAEEKECKRRVLGVLRDLSVFHSDGVTAWREVLRDWAHMFAKSPPGGSDQQHPSPTGM